MNQDCLQLALEPLDPAHDRRAGHAEAPSRLCVGAVLRELKEERAVVDRHVVIMQRSRAFSQHIAVLLERDARRGSRMSRHDLVVRGGTVVDGTGQPPFVADVAVQRGRIVAVGQDVGRAHREVDARGAIVTPGFVDAHTHYDGQATWDPDLTPSSTHGVTTVVMGCCGVGFAPVRPDERDFMVRIMEGVEEIPGAALEEGIRWEWESFGEYLDTLEGQRRAIDVATQVPHCALQSYVMGRERALDDDARDEDIQEMAALTHQALTAGALGFSTSRTILHRAKGGELVPGTHSDPRELLAIAGALGNAGHGVFQMISDHMGDDPDFPWMKAIAERSGGPLVFTLAQKSKDPLAYRAVLERLARCEREEGLDLRAAVPWRPPGVLLGLGATLHPYSFHPSARALRGLSVEAKVVAFRDPAFRAKLAAEETTADNPILRAMLTRADNQFVLGDPPEYEPPPETSIQAQATRTGRSVDDVLFDALAADEGRGFLYVPFASYVGGDFGAPRNDRSSARDGFPLGQRRPRGLRVRLKRDHLHDDALGPRSTTRSDAAPGVRRAETDAGDRRTLRAAGPRAGGRGDEGGPQRHRSRRAASPRSHRRLRLAPWRTPTDAAGRRVPRHPRRRRSHRRGWRADRGASRETRARTAVTSLTSDASLRVRPYPVEVDAVALANLRARIDGTRWAEEATDKRQGIARNTLREVMAAWREHDWAPCAAALDSFGSSVTTIDGLDVHFLHVRSPREDAPALLLTHGWPSSPLEFVRVLPRLREDFHVVVPSLPGFGFSSKPTESGWGVERIADAWDALMRGLRYGRYIAHGGDWGSMVTLALMRRHSARCAAGHITFLAAPPPPEVLSAPSVEEQDALLAIAKHRKGGSGYAEVQRTRPQTLGYSLVDSPVGMAAWLLEKYEAWTDGPGFGQLPMTWLFDQLTLWWLTASGASAARIYWESYAHADVSPVEGPMGLSVFPGEIVRPSERWARSSLRQLVYYQRAERGGHFAAAERPELFAQELCAFVEPSRRNDMSELNVRTLPFDFEDVRFMWNPEHRGFSIFGNSISFGRWVLRRGWCA